MDAKPTCPACGAMNPTEAHLILEYREMLRAGFDRMFGHNARKACNEIVDRLAEMGVTEFTDLFGTRKLEKWTY